MDGTISRLTTMVASGELELVYPDQLHSSKQAYRTVD